MQLEEGVLINFDGNLKGNVAISGWEFTNVILDSNFKMLY